ncbi:polycomb group protein ASXL1 isoform X2 [Varanus komodoensis]|uniref:polycomb group protein ASXL1 isoform X2 n=1 Tax=Varanus komodoensis TaxID=61221 RepID=UPI001CF7921E|nr:polycomb group protein ASXL1 isoform X2 [Varanus komodoensis]
MKEMKQRRKKERTWAEAARLVLENYSDGPMTPKQILRVIETEGLKEMSGTSPLACLNAMLHSNSRSCDGLFYKLPGRISLFTLKKDAVQWSRNLAAPEGEELDDTADAESSGSNEAASTVSGDNDISLDETSSNASCSTEPPSKSVPAVRESHRAASQASKQKKKTGVMLPRVVLTPLKVNGAHMESSSGFTGRQAGGESSGGGSSALCSTPVRGRTDISRDPPQLLRGFRKPSGGQMKRNRGDDIDFETPGSILVNTNLRALINSRTFNALPLHFQQQLLLLLPEVDRQAGTDGLMRLSGSALNNEFFTHAAQSWRERLADGEFTHEMQVRIRQEMEKEKKTEQWKERFFEDYYGQKLGLTREEPQPQNLVLGDTESKAALTAHKEPAQVQLGPVTRQRDGHLKKHSLRCRTRRSLYKLRESEPAEAAREALSAEADSSGCGDTKPEADLSKGGQASLAAETPPEAARNLSKAGEVLSLATAAARIPSLSQEPQGQESKEQKRKCFEQAASASFPEKKPRLEDRQSFRNTIESVHPEKPQPTKEEPKVPPIRIQLSRIKPPWVVKGQPAYQICPRIIPRAEPSRQDGAEAAAPADFEARALQGRVQREAAAPAAPIGGGGGPGGGGRCTDKGGGGGGRIQQPGSRPKCWRSKRTRGKCVPRVQRAQLLPPPHLGEEAGLKAPARAGLPACARGAEGGAACERAPGRVPAAAGGAAQLAESWGGSCPGGARATPPLDGTAAGTPAGDASHLPADLSQGLSPWAASRGDHDQEAAREPPSRGPPIRALLERSPVALLGGTGSAEMCDGVLLNGGGAAGQGTSGGARCSPEPLRESGGGDPLAGSGPGSAQHSRTVGMDGSAPLSHAAPQQLAEHRQGKTAPSELYGSREDAAAPPKPAPLSDGPGASCGRFAPHRLPPWEVVLRIRTETASPLAEERPSSGPGPFSDEETRSVLSETTETASDLEAESTDENVELAQENHRAAKKGAAPPRGSVAQYNGIKSESPGNAGALAFWKDLPSEAGDAGLCQPQRQGPQTTCEPALPAEPGSPERPVPSAPKPLSVEASSPLVMQLLKGNLPLEAALPGSLGSTKAATGASLPDWPSAQGPLPAGSKGGGLLPKAPHEAMGVCGPVRNGYHVPQSLRDSSQRQRTADPALLPVEGLEKGPECPESGPTPSALDQAASASQKPDAPGWRAGAAPSCGRHDQKEPSPVAAAEPITPEGPDKKPGALTGRTVSAGPSPLGGEPVPKSHGACGKKVFGSGFTARAQRAGALEPFPIVGMLSHSRPAAPPPRSAPPGACVPPAREEWPPKQRGLAGGGTGAESKPLLAAASPAKRRVEKGTDASPSPAELVGHLPSVPLVRDFPFFKLPREPGRGFAQPLEPSSIPSQLNIKQAFYGKLSKLQLNSAGLNYSSSTPVFPRSLAGSMMPLGHKVNFAASRGVSLSAQMFADGSSMEEISLQCSCSLKAMIMCKGCGAFCHDDCIGPSKLCVLCLVVR